jgi:hypothetical protein
VIAVAVRFAASGDARSKYPVMKSEVVNWFVNAVLLERVVKSFPVYV